MKFVYSVEVLEMNKRIDRLLDEAKLTAVQEMFEPELYKFAELVAAAEREECARIAEDGLIGHTIAKAIRARGDA